MAQSKYVVESGGVLAWRAEKKENATDVTKLPKDEAEAMCAVVEAAIKAGKHCAVSVHDKYVQYCVMANPPRAVVIASPTEVTKESLAPPKLPDSKIRRRQEDAYVLGEEAKEVLGDKEGAELVAKVEDIIAKGGNLTCHEHDGYVKYCLSKGLTYKVPSPTAIVVDKALNEALLGPVNDSSSTSSTTIAPYRRTPATMEVYENETAEAYAQRAGGFDHGEGDSASNNNTGVEATPGNIAAFRERAELAERRIAELSERFDTFTRAYKGTEAQALAIENVQLKAEIARLKAAKK
jgi:hypothetical protein